MTPFTKIGEFEYWTDLIDAARTSKNFQESSDLLRSKSNKNNMAGYGAWMFGRRAGEYAAFALQQKRQIHSTALVANGSPVCSCALVADSQIENTDGNENWLRASQGHLDQNVGEVVTAFYIRQYSDEFPFGALHFLCQICSAIELAEVTCQENLDAILLADFRKLHAHNDNDWSSR